MQTPPIQSGHLSLTIQLVTFLFPSFCTQVTESIFYATSLIKTILSVFKFRKLNE